MRALPGLLLLAGLLLALAPASALWAKEPPALAKGDSFVVRTTASTSEARLTALTQQDVVGPEPFAGEDAIRIEERTRATTARDGVDGNHSTNATTWRRASDLAVLRRFMLFENESDAEAWGVAYVPTCVNVHFPLVVGASWTLDCEQTAEDANASSTTTHRTTIRVLGVQNVTVPAGSFDAFVLESASPSTTIHLWYAPEACGIVKELTAVGTVDVKRELVSFDCDAGGFFAEATGKPTPGFGAALLLLGVIALCARGRFH